MPRNDTATVVNIGDQTWHIDRPYGLYDIPACEPGKQFAKLVVKPTTSTMDLGDDRKFKVPLAPIAIANDIVQDLEAHGVFVAEDEVPTPEELGKAAERRVQVARKLVEIADGEWARSRDYRQITDIQRRSAKLLGLEREWNSTPKVMQDCPFCGAKIPAAVAICRECKGVLDADKALKGGLISPEDHANITGTAVPVKAKK